MATVRGARASRVENADEGRRDRAPGVPPHVVSAPGRGRRARLRQPPGGGGRRAGGAAPRVAALGEGEEIESLDAWVTTVALEPGAERAPPAPVGAQGEGETRAGCTAVTPRPGESDRRRARALDAPPPPARSRRPPLLPAVRHAGGRAALRINEGTVKSTLSRARARSAELSATSTKPRRRTTVALDERLRREFERAARPGRSERRLRGPDPPSRASPDRRAASRPGALALVVVRGDDRRVLRALAGLPGDEDAPVPIASTPLVERPIFLLHARGAERDPRQRRTAPADAPLTPGRRASTGPSRLAGREPVLPSRSSPTGEPVGDRAR